MKPRSKRVTRALATLLLAASFLALAACGGKSQGTTQPAGPADGDGEAADSGDSKLISAQDLDAVTLYFERKNTVVSRCFTDAMDAGEAGDAKELYLTVTVKVLPGGKATNIRFSDATVRSQSLAACVRDLIEKWALPEVTQPFDYSHRYGFNAL
jgi:hypothetical protein